MLCDYSDRKMVIMIGQGALIIIPLPNGPFSCDFSESDTFDTLLVAQHPELIFLIYVVFYVCTYMWIERQWNEKIVPLLDMRSNFDNMDMHDMNE